MKYSANTIQLDSPFIDQNGGLDRSRETFARQATPLGKRVFDITVSSLVTLTVLTWMIPVIGLLVRLSSPGPIFFMQWRNGRNGRRFRCLKFRTMRFDRNAKFKQATANDPRITPIGRFLRKTNLDEMPQFLNVLMGDMSIVGPRPHAVEHDAQFEAVVPGYLARYAVKPGITGLAQTRGLRGETGMTDMLHRVRLDRWYIQRQSAVLDVKICWWTVEKMVKGDEKAV
jgi:putative colanic acid biosynthesis UDP-glucose lipid carrier transferase